MTLQLANEYVSMSSDGTAQVVQGGPSFWSLPADTLDLDFGRHWLVSEFACCEDWPNWEMHPIADELVCVLEGCAEFWLESAEGVKKVEVSATRSIVVPRGTWHTAKITQATRLLHFTMGLGTQHRPTNKDDHA